MSYLVSRFNMESLNKSYVWFAAMTILASFGSCAGAAGVSGRKPFTPSDSILDIIDTEQVERMLAARRRADLSAAAGTPRAPAYFHHNELDDDDTMLVSAPDRDEPTKLPPHIDFRKVLKTSKNALLVTKKEYLKEDWCKAEPLVQKIREPGCLTATVLNKFCYGQCNSFYIPKGPRRRDGGDDRHPPAFKSCSFCRPKKVIWITVTLRCPGQNPPYKRKRLQKIKQCKCLPVGVN